MKTINPEWKKSDFATRSAHKDVESIVVLKAEHKCFDELMGDLHYPGSAKPAGHFLRQAVVCDGKWVAILAWGPACYALRDRDEWIGWHAALRAERQKLVVQNRSYLLLHERGTEANLASKALASALRALPEQWEALFGYRPLLAETFTDIEKFRGTCYKACNWIEAGESQGFSRDALAFRSVAVGS
jgi:phospholipase C